MSNEVKLHKRYRHKKRGTTYVVLHRARMQASDWQGALSEGSGIEVEDQTVVIYRADEDGTVWCRPEYEFMDGRFEEMP